MKKLLNTLWVLCLCVSVTYAQSSQDAKTLKAALSDYLNIIQKKDIDGILDYMPPQMFELAPRAQMKEELGKGSFQNMTLQKVEIRKVSSVMKHNKAKYALAEYFSEAVLQVPKEEENRLETMVTVMKSMLGEDKVKVDKAKRQITMSIISKMYAINSPEVKGWKFIQKDDGSEAFLEKIVPKEVQEKLKL
ncbi:hypothetical protein BKI52_04490 [marine bacterium AO1-C]|nr:hypothetical protein BKI52_04490 [marine bacterium AO1-C]